ncbi:DUF2730 family protein [Rhizobium sp. CECT 9324]|uniref:DUF2730 family protein n=1 Tax=Rhizobium sp. CECT 9324 TaxID=2845820 RepID=UPI001E2985A4|nr:DUF2730 family protein [Rhizobium sp. CECT 9324]CAH0339589.1 hypothetical protein RHI9324_01240 [Rhizobium sp. CECT 9324]
MTTSEIYQYLGLALAVIALLGHAKGYFSSGEKTLLARIDKAEAKVEKVETKLVEYDRRIQSIEGEIKHLPDRETTHRMELAMTEISGKLNVMAERLKPIEAIGERLQETLMERAR